MNPYVKFGRDQPNHLAAYKLNFSV